MSIIHEADPTLISNISIAFRFSSVFWIDASSIGTITQGLKGICNLPAAQSSGLDGSPESALHWIGSLKENYVMVFDNADVLSPAELQTYFPLPGMGGNIVITSRNAAMQSVTLPENSLEVTEMEENDAIELLLKASCLDPCSIDFQAEATKIVKELSYHPLSIDQAGAYIASGATTIGKYLRDPNKITAMESVAATYHSLGRYTEAEKLEIQVMDARKRILGVERPDTVKAMESLAATYNDLGKHTDAEKLKIQVLDARNRILGVEHPDTIHAMGNLAATHHKLGDSTEAEKLKIKVLDPGNEILGVEHPDEIIAMKNLIATCHNPGKHTEEENLQIQAQEAQSRVSGQQHSYSHNIQTMSNVEEVQQTDFFGVRDTVPEEQHSHSHNIQTMSNVEEVQQTDFFGDTVPEEQHSHAHNIQTISNVEEVQQTDFFGVRDIVPEEGHPHSQQLAGEILPFTIINPGEKGMY